MKNIILILMTAFMLSACNNTFADIGSYTEGTEISSQTMDKLVVGKTNKKDIEKLIGYPLDKQKIGKTEIWRYPFQKIRSFGSNINETTVFEFNRKGILTKKYKAKGGSSNPLLRH